MSGATITVKIDDKEVLDALRALAAAAADKVAINKKVASVLLESTRLRFRSGTDPDGVAWDQSRRATSTGKGKTLRDTGVLANSIVSTATENAAIVGTDVEYAAIHQFGGTIVPRHGRALAIPLTREAVQAGRPGKFPRRLALIWKKGQSYGFLIEKKQPGTKRETQRERILGRMYAAAKAEYSGQAGSGTVFQYMLVRKSVIPARPFLGISEQDRKDIHDALIAHLARSVRK